MMKCKLTATEIVEFLNLKKPIDKAHLEDFEKLNHVKLPQPLFQFMLVASNNPLFSTSDIWNDVNLFRFFYEDIEEKIGEEQEYWEIEPKNYSDDEYFQFAQLPKEKWPEKCCNYLEIGSDFGAGIATLGIRIADLKCDDPPIYMNHEENRLTDWEPCYDNLSDYLRAVTCDALLCVDYHTAQKVLEKDGWKFREYKDSAEVEPLLFRNAIDLLALYKFASFHAGDILCCCSEAENTLFVIKSEKNTLEMCVISK